MIVEELKQEDKEGKKTHHYVILAENRHLSKMSDVSGHILYSA